MRLNTLAALFVFYVIVRASFALLVLVQRRRRDQKRLVLTDDEVLSVLSERDFQSPEQVYQLLRRRWEGVYPNFTEEVAVADVKIVLMGLNYRVARDTDVDHRGRSVFSYKKQPLVTMEQLTSKSI